MQNLNAQHKCRTKVQNVRQSRRETGASGSVATRGSVNGRGPCHGHGRDSTVGAYCPQALAPQAQHPIKQSAYFQTNSNILKMKNLPI